MLVTSSIDRALAHLAALVAFNTQNPPRAHNASSPIFDYLAKTLRDAGCDVSLTGLGDGSVNLLATRGSANTLINCHLDTVPVCNGWTADPFTASITNGRVHALGACDVKGPASALLAAIEADESPVAVLFTSDEEAGQARCVRTFAASTQCNYDLVVVTEPTQLQCVTSHRGILTCEADFTGVGAHSSSQHARSAIHSAIRWSHSVLTDLAPGDGANPHRLNIGRIEGGAKPNVVASTAKLLLGMRPAAGVDPEALLTRLKHANPAHAPSSLRTRFCAPALRACNGAGAKLAGIGINPAGPVDFWTEAALFAEAGHEAVVYGPGDIAQAHTPDEWIAIDQLERAAEQYVSLLAL